jgi:DNA-binding response OmpR family regulator
VNAGMNTKESGGSIFPRKWEIIIGGYDSIKDMTASILVVEDEPSLQETLIYNLEKEGFTVRSEANGLEAITTARSLKPDLVILDVMLPGIDGFEVCRILRQEMNMPILMLTARAEEIDRVVGLEVGADDYLTKPFSMRELLARVRAQLRRSRVIQEELEKLKQVPADIAIEKITFDNLEINLTRRDVSLDGEVINMKPKEYELLLFFAQHHRQMLSREFILERVWGWDYIGDSRTVDVHVRWLRQKIEKDPANPVRLVTVRGGGYRFEG